MERVVALSIFEHVDYRVFLTTWLDDPGRRISRRTYSRRAGCSPPLLSAIEHGARDLEPSRARAFAKAMDLAAESADYFTNLVLARHGSTLDERRAAWDR